MSEAPQPTTAAEKQSSARVLPALILAMLSFSVVQTAVVPILPSLAKELSVSGSNITWLMTANLLSAAVLTPLLGRFGDLRGRKPMLLISLTGLVAAPRWRSAPTPSPGWSSPVSCRAPAVACCRWQSASSATSCRSRR